MKSNRWTKRGGWLQEEEHSETFWPNVSWSRSSWCSEQLHHLQVSLWCLHHHLLPPSNCTSPSTHNRWDLLLSIQSTHLFIKLINSYIQYVFVYARSVLFYAFHMDSWPAWNCINAHVDFLLGTNQKTSKSYDLWLIRFQLDSCSLKIDTFTRFRWTLDFLCKAE